MRISGITYVPRKTHKARNVVIVAVILVLIAFLSLVLISAYFGWQITHPKRTDIPPFESNIAPEFKDVTFTDINKKVALKGWYFSAKGSDRVVILAHSYGANRLQFGIKTLELIKGLLAKGYNVLAFDFRNSGRSGGSRTSFGYYEKSDLLGAVNHVKTAGSNHIVLLGFSYGASASILAASESKDIEAVIADSPYADLKGHFNDVIPSWSGLPDYSIFNNSIMLAASVISGVDFNSVSPEKVVGKIAPRPILFIHGENDTLIPDKNSRKLYNIYLKAAEGKAELWETAGAGHIESYVKYTQDYMSHIYAFLDKVYPSKQQ